MECFLSGMAFPWSDEFEAMGVDVESSAAILAHVREMVQLGDLCLRYELMLCIESDEIAGY